MIIEPSKILPTQDFLKPGTIKFIFDCIREGKLGSLPPAPILRYGKSGELLAIDGHNLIAVKYFLGEDIEVHVAQSKEDGLKGVSEKSLDRNNDLKEKYVKVLELRLDTVQRGVDTFQDLIDQNRELFNKDSLV